MATDVPETRRGVDGRVLARVGSLELRARRVMEGLLSGMHRSPYQGASIEFAQHRPYTVGDDIRHVDWKVMARRDKVYVKQYQVETNLQLQIAVDFSRSMRFSSIKGTDGQPWSKLDHAMVAAVALAYVSGMQSDSAGVWGLGLGAGPVQQLARLSAQPGHWRQVAEVLEATVAKQSDVATPSLAAGIEGLANTLARRSVVVILSDGFDDLAAVERALGHLRFRRHDVVLLQVMDPAELTFPFDRSTQFVGLETGDKVLVEPRDLKRAYLEQVAAFTGSLKRLLRGLGGDYSLLDTSGAVDVQLARLLAERMAAADGSRAGIGGGGA